MGMGQERQNYRPGRWGPAILALPCSFPQNPEKGRATSGRGPWAHETTYSGSFLQDLEISHHGSLTSGSHIFVSGEEEGMGQSRVGLGETSKLNSYLS